MPTWYYILSSKERDVLKSVRLEEEAKKEKEAEREEAEKEEAETEEAEKD